MIPKPLSEVTFKDLLGLVDGQVREGKTIEYKRELPGGADEHKREFLADVSSFANTSGGDLVFGAVEDQGLPTEFPGVAADMDQETLRLENLIRTGIEPRLPGAEVRPIGTADGRHVLVVRIRQSWNMPHRVTFRDHAKFYGRNSAGKYPLDVNELRVAFTQSDTLAERVRRFREERLIKLGAGRGPVAMREGAVFCLHVVPLSAYSTHDLLSLDDQDRLTNLVPPGNSGFNYRRNLDGFVNFTGAGLEEGSRAYSQIFRNGVLEFASVFSRREGHVSIHGPSVDYYALSCLERALRFYRSGEVSAPFLVLLSLLGVDGASFEAGDRLGFHDPEPVDRDSLILPEIFIEDLDKPLHTALRPALDMVWNAWGLPQSLSYDHEGNWRERR